ncbi:hypothetical protein FOL47_007427 [Perkinsus chesapeaki]|uniref:Uncharacterized protein n=1 Tax=Perkinsus chesapeaki TaxID=330153 RepID=A0A7J6MVK9_PERCH|nr:hypothetical protein FOL47_007427 [Perkinsus chesapeaki]
MTGSLTTLDRLERLSLYTALIDKLYQLHAVEGTLPYLAEDIIQYLWPYRRALRSIIERPAYCGGGRLQYAFVSRGEAFGAIVSQSYGNSFQLTNHLGGGFGRGFPGPKEDPYQCFYYGDGRKMVYAFDPTTTVINCEGIDLPYFSKEYKNGKVGDIPAGLRCPHIRWLEESLYIAGVTDDHLCVWRTDLCDDNCQYSATVVWKSSSEISENLADFFLSRGLVTNTLCIAFCSGDRLVNVNLGPLNSVSVIKLPFEASTPITMLTPSMVCRTAKDGENATTLEVVEIGNDGGRIVFKRHFNWIVDRLFTTLRGSVVAVSEVIGKVAYIKGMQYDTAWEGPEEDDDVDVIEPLGSDTGEWDSADESD